MDRLLMVLNAIPIGERRLRVSGDWLFASSVDRYLAALAWKWGWLEARERRYITRTVQDGMVAVDVGANLGFHTLTLARQVGAGGRVHAIEPEPNNFRALARAIEVAGLPQVALHRAAAHECAAPIQLYLSRANRGDHQSFAGSEARPSISVPAIVLDDLLSSEALVDFVKIDVQGAEVAVLRGLLKTLEANREICVLCELCPRLLRASGNSAEDFFQPFRAATLTAHLLDRDARPEPVDEARAWSLAEASGHINLVFRRV